MQLDILTPEGQVYSGEADLVQMPGLDGLFEVLKNHAPMIAALAEGSMKVEHKGQTQRFRIRPGFVEVLRNRISVLVESAELEQGKAA
jgi:F-type H+-transporting ATPase subunit epsilon